MENIKKDLYFYFNDSEHYRFDVSLLCLNRRRGYKYMPCAEMIAVALDEYDPLFPEYFLMLDSVRDVCNYFVENYNFTFREDVSYLIRHPEFMKQPDENPIITYKKIRFNTGDALQKKAYDWLHEYKPRERIDEAIKVVRQYLIFHKDEYFIEQTVLQMLKSLNALNKGEDDLSDDAKWALDTIWSIAGYTNKRSK